MTALERNAKPAALQTLAAQKLRAERHTLPGFGGANFTPARRALESPMAMACFVERAPCFPARISSISSRTNSPAWVEGDFPSRLSRRARSMVCFFGMIGTQKMLSADRSKEDAFATY